MQTQFEKPFVVIAASGVIETALLPYHLVHLKSHYNIKLAVAVTPSAFDFVTNTALHAISQHIVYDNNMRFDPISGKPWHIILSSADLLVLYPASARIIAQCANGEITCPVTRLFAFTEKKRIAVCPALHPNFDIRIYINHLDMLDRLGCNILAHRLGDRIEPPSWDAVESFIQKELNIVKIVPASEFINISKN
jgi:hypothetical protein